MNARAVPFAASLALFAACASAPPALPTAEHAAAGVTSFDEQPPAGAETWQRPTWQVGDTFTLVRGDRLRGTFEVLDDQDGVYSIDVGNGSLLRRTADLGNLGSWSREDGAPVRVMEPADVRYHWPLWVGKRWTCQFVDRMRDGQALTMQASYDVEARDTVTVPAGTFDTLRIVRRLQLQAEEGSYLTRTQMVWYAPNEGLEVRQLLGDTLVELAAYETK